MTDKTETPWQEYTRKNREANARAAPIWKAFFKIFGWTFGVLLVLAVISSLANKNGPDASSFEAERLATRVNDFLATPAGVQAYTEGGIMRCRQNGWDADKCFTEVCRGHDGISGLEICERMITLALDSPR